MGPVPLHRHIKQQGQKRQGPCPVSLVHTPGAAFALKGKSTWKSAGTGELEPDKNSGKGEEVPSTTSHAPGELLTGAPAVRGSGLARSGNVRGYHGNGMLCSCPGCRGAGPVICSYAWSCRRCWGEEVLAIHMCTRF